MIVLLIITKTAMEMWLWWLGDKDETQVVMQLMVIQSKKEICRRDKILYRLLPIEIDNIVWNYHNEANEKNKDCLVVVLGHYKSSSG